MQKIEIRGFKTKKTEKGKRKSFFKKKRAEKSKSKSKKPKSKNHEEIGRKKEGIMKE